MTSEELSARAAVGGGEGMNIDPNTATLEQCCDYIAECKEYVRINSGSMSTERQVWAVKTECGLVAKKDPFDHPVPPTLDSIAGCLPEGWGATSIGDNRTPGGTPRFPWTCRLFRFSDQKEVFAWGDTEKLARARAAVAAWEIVKRAKP